MEKNMNLIYTSDASNHCGHAYCESSHLAVSELNLLFWLAIIYSDVIQQTHTPLAFWLCTYTHAFMFRQSNWSFVIETCLDVVCVFLHISQQVSLIWRIWPCGKDTIWKHKASSFSPRRWTVRVIFIFNCRTYPVLHTSTAIKRKTSCNQSFQHQFFFLIHAACMFSAAICKSFIRLNTHIHPFKIFMRILSGCYTALWLIPDDNISAPGFACVFVLITFNIFICPPEYRMLHAVGTQRPQQALGIGCRV